MGSCETHPEGNIDMQDQVLTTRNPFFEPQAAEGGEDAILAQYRFISNY